VTRKTYMTRADFMENIQIPQSTAVRIIIPSNQNGSGFLKHCYKSEFLGKLMSEDEFDGVIDHISKLTE